MLIICPSCAAEYDVPAARLPPQKLVRCARCGGEWVPTRDTDEIPSVEDTPPAPLQPEAEVEPVTALPSVTAMDRLAVPLPRPPQLTGLRVAWLMTLVILVAALAGAVAWRGTVVRAWPPGARILGSGDLASGQSPLREPSHLSKE